MGAAGGRDAIGTAPIVRFERANPARLDKAGDRSVQRARAEFDAGELLDIEHHGIAVFIAVGKAGEDQKSGVGHDNTSYDASYDVLFGKSTEIDCELSFRLGLYRGSRSRSCRGGYPASYPTSGPAASERR